MLTLATTDDTAHHVRVKELGAVIIATGCFQSADNVLTVQTRALGILADVGIKLLFATPDIALHEIPFTGNTLNVIEHGAHVHREVGGENTPCSAEFASPPCFLVLDQFLGELIDSATVGTNHVLAL